MQSMQALVYLLFLLNFVSAGYAQEQAIKNYKVGQKESSVKVNGIDLYYRLVGEGPPVLLLHGFSGAGSWWDSLIDELSKENALIIPDLPAHGRSSSHIGPYLYSQVAQDLVALMDHLQIEQFDAIGYSAGGQILLHVATQVPGRVEAMVLVSSIHRIPDDLRVLLKSWPDIEDNPPAVQEFWRSNHPGGDEQINSLIAALRSLSEYNGNVEFTTDQLSKIGARTLLVLGDSDVFVPLELALEMYRAIPEASIWVIPSQGHSAIWPGWGGSPEARDIFPSVTNSFLNRAE